MVSVEHHTVTVNNIQLHYVEAGQGPLVILLHGFPETWYAWRHQIPVLAKTYRVVAPDLRGYGSSDKPAHGYDKRTMATDIKELMTHLGEKKAAVIGHDRGARVATRFVKDFPELVDRWATLDNIPTRIIFERMNAEVAKAHWFFLFNNVPDLPELLISGREEQWLRFIFSTWCYNPELFSGQEIAVYATAYSQPGGLRGGFSDYRAGPDDLVQDKQDKDTLIKTPTLVLWGEDFAAGGKMWDFREVWHRMVEAEALQFLSLPKCGHLPHEEQPDAVSRALMSFLVPWEG